MKWAQEGSGRKSKARNYERDYDAISWYHEDIKNNMWA